MGTCVLKKHRVNRLAVRDLHSLSVEHMLIYRPAIHRIRRGNPRCALGAGRPSLPFILDAILWDGELSSADHRRLHRAGAEDANG